MKIFIDDRFSISYTVYNTSESLTWEEQQMNDIEYHSRVLAALDALDSKEREQVFAVVASLKNAKSQWISPASS
jgi:hypothetical protein